MTMNLVSRVIRINLADQYLYVKRVASWRDKLLGDPISIWVVECIWTWRWLTPTAITLLSFALAIVACYAFALGGWNLTIGAVIWEIAHWLDCVDGKLARKTRNFSKTGAWLDKNLDRVKRVAAMGCLAYSFSGDWRFLAIFFVFNLLIRRFPIRKNESLDRWTTEIGVLAIIHPQDELFLIFTVGPLIQSPLAGVLLAILTQIIVLVVHRFAGAKDAMPKP